MLRITTMLLTACSTPVAQTVPRHSPVLSSTPSEQPTNAPEPTITDTPDAALAVPAQVEPPTLEPTMNALPLSSELRAAMTGVSWHRGCPVALDDLVLLQLPYRDHQGAETIGEMIVHRDVHVDVGMAFAQLHQGGFTLTQMRLAHHFGGDDDAIMAADNTSAFNCRKMTSGKSWSEHSYGRALDINPLRNPYVVGSTVLPPGGRGWLERDASRPGVIVDGGTVTNAFDAIGWPWGGRWRTAKDYQHFSKSGF
ncbi:MAG: hypothetical protein ACI9MC_000526 [Kiritimatiellia bacterium]|jgi:hypothetical protein